MSNVVENYEYVLVVLSTFGSSTEEKSKKNDSFDLINKPICFEMNVLRTICLKLSTELFV